MQTEKSENRPPLEWFVGIGRKDRGILNVTVSEIFTSLGEGEVKRHWSEWSHYTGNPLTPDDPAERVERATRVITEAEVFISQVTGYHPRDIFETASRLRRQYQGKNQAPFAIELY